MKALLVLICVQISEIGNLHK